MANEFTAVVERDGKWFIAYCPEVPGANGQGNTKDEALSSLAEAIALILDRRLVSDRVPVQPAAGIGPQAKIPITRIKVTWSWRRPSTALV